MTIAITIFGVCAFVLGFFMGNWMASRYAVALLIVNGYKAFHGHLFPHKYSDDMIKKAKKIIPDV